MEPFSIVGCDYAGTVVSVGPKVTKSFKEGDSIFGCVNGANTYQSYDGAFAEYIVVKGDVSMHIPSSISPEDACTVPLGAITVGQGMFQQNKGLSLHLPGEGKGNGEFVFIYGGSTATGALGIQFAREAGYKVLTTCSPKNNEYVKSLGATEVFDYNDPEVGSKIRAFTSNKLKYAWDTQGDASSGQICADALSSEGEDIRFGTITDPSMFLRKDAKVTATIMYTIFGEAFTKYGHDFPVLEADFEFAKMWMSLVEKLVSEGKVKPHRKKVGTGGLEGVVKGLEELKSGKVSGQKLVYNI
jgi:NADPH:quinone reductase-like Zn-dependent oxidoreductase